MKNPPDLTGLHIDINMYTCIFRSNNKPFSYTHTTQCSVNLLFPNLLEKACLEYFTLAYNSVQLKMFNFTLIITERERERERAGES